MNIEEHIERLKLDIDTPLYCGDCTIVLLEDLTAVLDYIDIMQKEFDRLEGIEDNTAMLKCELEKNKQLINNKNTRLSEYAEELVEAEKVIDLMAEQIFYWQDDKFPLGYSIKDVKEYYYEKVSDNK